MNEPELPEVVKEKLEYLDKQRQRTLALVPALGAAYAVVEELREEMPDCTFNVGMPIYGDCVEIDVFGCSLNEAVPIMRVLAQRGYRQSSPGSQLDIFESNLRMYYCGDIRLSMHPAVEKCHRVKVGEKTEP